MGSEISLRAADGHTFDAYEALADGAAATVVVIQEIFGVNRHIRSIVDRYANVGYNAIAPALFDRVERGVDLGYDDEGLDAGITFAGQLDWVTTMADVAATVERASESGPVGIVGYCFGGTVAWLAAARLPVAAAVGYYGGGIVGFKDETPQVPTLLHFGALDAHIPLDGVRAVAEANPKVEIEMYEEADHGFNCDARSSYDAASAVLAQRRTFAFFTNNGVVPA